MDIDLKAYKLSNSKVESLVKKDKKYDHITGAGFSKLDELLSFMHGVGIYDLIDSIKSPLKRAPIRKNLLFSASFSGLFYFDLVPFAKK